MKDRMEELQGLAPEEDDEWADFQGSTEEGFMNEFFERIQTIQDCVDQIKETVENVEQLQSTILSSPTQDEEKKQQMEELMECIKKLATKVRSNLKHIEQSIEEDEAKDISSADLRIRKSQHATIQRKFVDVMTQYNKAQCNFREGMKGRLVRQLDIAGKHVEGDELDELLDGGDASVLTQGVCVDPQKAKQTLADIEARHSDLMKLETSIRELHDMFMDMAMIVESQGEMIDRIDYNVEHAAEYVDKATSAVRKAGEYQRAARRKKILCMAIGGLAGGGFAIYILNKFM